MSVVRKSCKMAAALLSFVLLLGMLLSLSSCRANSYTEEEHIARVTERAKVHDCRRSSCHRRAHCSRHGAREGAIFGRRQRVYGA